METKTNLPPLEAALVLKLNPDTPLDIIAPVEFVLTKDQAVDYTYDLIVALNTGKLIEALTILLMRQGLKDTDYEHNKATTSFYGSLCNEYPFLNQLLNRIMILSVYPDFQFQDMLAYKFITELKYDGTRAIFNPQT